MTQATPIATLNPPTTPERHRFHFLDALRGVAAILVIFRHAPHVFQRGLASHNSFLAVDFFFCLSGFVIAFSYEARLRASMTFLRFTLARAIRLLPVAILGTLIGACELAWDQHRQGHIAPGKILLLTLFGAALIPYFPLSSPAAGLFPLNGAMWTLCAEVIANLAYAAQVKLNLAHSRIVMAICVSSLLLLTYERKVHNTFDLGFLFGNAHIGLLRVIFSFFAGVLVFRLYRHRAPQRLHGQRAVWAGVAVASALVLCLCNPSNLSQIAQAELFTVCVAFPGIVYLGALVIFPKTLNALCVFLGTISYPLYILHPPFLWLLGRRTPILFGQAHPDAAPSIMLAYTTAMVGLAWLLSTAYEWPVRNWLTRYVSSHQKISQAAPPSP